MSIIEKVVDTISTLKKSDFQKVKSSFGKKHWVCAVERCEWSFTNPRVISLLVVWTFKKFRYTNVGVRFYSLLWRGKNFFRIHKYTFWKEMQILFWTLVLSLSKYSLNWKWLFNLFFYIIKYILIILRKKIILKLL